MPSGLLNMQKHTTAKSDGTAQSAPRSSVVSGKAPARDEEHPEKEYDDLFRMSAQAVKSAAERRRKKP